MKKDPLEILQIMAQVVYDKKGFNTLAIDVQGMSSITDFVLIAEANVDRHASSIAKAIIETLSALGEKPLHTEGIDAGDWIVLDYGQIMVHIFTPGLRERYSLERLWVESKIVDLEIDTSKKISAL